MKTKQYSLSILFTIMLCLLSVSSYADLCYAEACCNESCTETVSCEGSISCHADGVNGVVTCDGARAYCA